MGIESPDDDELQELRAELALLAPQLEESGAWPGEQLRWCAESGVFEWFLPTEAGGAAWDTVDIMRGYLQLSAGCVTTTFVITQYMGAARRIAGSDNVTLKQALLPKLRQGECYATVGISHLTTSRRHLATPVLAATESEDGGFILQGQAPWVTGAAHADWIVVGASLEDGREILAAIPRDTAGVHVGAAAELVALTASRTGPVHFEQCHVSPEWLLAGPTEHVMKQGVGANTGGVQTSILALGLTRAAHAFLLTEAEQREELEPACEALAAEMKQLEQDLLATAAGQGTCSTEELRTRANSLVLRCTQSALTAAKGTGFVQGHPAGRWCREALFFLVWSCPQSVVSANLCELAGIA